jgi:predicted KAP-like P-loop ATPase
METGETTMTNEQKAAKLEAAANLLAKEARAEMTEREAQDLPTTYAAHITDFMEDFANRVAILDSVTRARLFDLITQDALATA